MNNTGNQSFFAEIAERSPFAFATVAGGLSALIMLIMQMIPGLNVIVLIVVMLPLSLLQNFSGLNLGRDLNGFFLPNATGWLLVLLTIWLFWLAIGFRRQWRTLREQLKS